MSNPDPSRAALADELEAALTTFLNARSNDRVIAGAKLTDILWNNKSGIVAHLRSPLPSPTAPVLSMSQREIAGAIEHLNELFEKAPWMANPVNANGYVAGCHPVTYGDLNALRALPPTLNSGACEKIEQREKDIQTWLIENAPFTFADQRHLDEDTPERAYWHHGYRCALIDTLKILALPRTVEGGAVQEAINALLEKIADKFEGWDTADIWRTDAAMVVRGFKNDQPNSDPKSILRAHDKLVATIKGEI